MTSRQYARIEELMAKAEDITMEHPLLTPQGREIQKELRDLLVRIAAERVRAIDREASGTTTGGR